MSAPGKPGLVPGSPLPPATQNRAGRTLGRQLVLTDGTLLSSLSVLDTNDRFLRKITIGQANTEKGYSRQVGGLFFTGVALLSGALVYSGSEARSPFSAFASSFLSLQWPRGAPTVSRRHLQPLSRTGRDRKEKSPALRYYPFLV